MPSAQAIQIDISVVHQWNINTLEMNDAGLISCVKSVFTHFGILEEMEIGDGLFMGFVWECHYYYERNGAPFHNFKHAVNVCHAGGYFIEEIPALRESRDRLGILSLLVACLAHDLDHRGMTNSFEVGSQSDIAIRYFDNSPLENHHAAILFKILSNPQYDIFKSIPEDKLKEIKLNIIENILATDMKVHFPMLADFKQKALSKEDTCNL